LISTFEKSGSGGEAAGGCWANTGPVSAVMVAMTATLTLFIPASPSDFLMS
jgi:hypothetical protein